jgi:AcrR family transcriptional regulator
VGTLNGAKGECRYRWTVSTPIPLVSSRPWLSTRQNTTVTALLDAGIVEIRDHGYERVTIRGIAKRAGVTHTTAYSYFTSKEHLVSEIHWRQMRSLPTAQAFEGASLWERVQLAFDAATAVLAAEPEVSRGVLVAILGDDPEIRRVRELVGKELAHRLTTALAPADDPELVETLLIAYSGATTVVGTGSQEYASVMRRLRTVVGQIDRTGDWKATQ